LDCPTCARGICENCLLEANRLFATNEEQHPQWKTCTGCQNEAGCNACFQPVPSASDSSKQSILCTSCNDKRSEATMKK
jgi:hypothetical protein